MDCDLLTKVYINLIDQKEPTLNFQIQNEKIVEKRAGGTLYYKKIIKPNSQELQEHKEYLKSKLKKFFNLAFRYKVFRNRLFYQI